MDAIERPTNRCTNTIWLDYVYMCSCFNQIHFFYAHRWSFPHCERDCQHLTRPYGVTSATSK